MLDRRNYVELVALLLVVVLFSLHLPLWGMIMDACAEPMIRVFFGLILSVMLIDVLTMIYWRRDCSFRMNEINAVKRVFGILAAFFNKQKI